MSAFMVASITAHNLDWVAEYMENVPLIIRKYGGKYLAIAKGGLTQLRLSKAQHLPHIRLSSLRFLLWMQ